jgi:hypothetical protein
MFHIKLISETVLFVRDFSIIAITVSALVPATIATIALFCLWLLYWLELYRVHHWTEVSSIDKRLPIFSGKISHSFACVLIPDFKIT